MGYDILFIHPPSVYDFRKRAFFPGPVDVTVPIYTHQFIMFPVGLVSIAEYLERHGYKVKIFNLGEQMLADPTFDAEKYISKTESTVYAIDLHWCVHSQGAIEVARICKKHHPNSFVVLGGLTATRFHDEVIRGYWFIDGVLRGEAEEPTLRLLENLEKHKRLKETPNLTYRDRSGRVRVNPLQAVCNDLDRWEFTRLDLVTPNNLLLSFSNEEKTWNLPICRGCIYNCVSCGGSKYSYKKLFGREKPAFRSPFRIVEDLQVLKEQGIRHIFLFQDPRIGGKRYWRMLTRSIRRENMDDLSLLFELFSPADKEFLKSFSRLGAETGFTISPESGVESVRKAHGRNYSNEQLLRTVKNCLECKLTLSVFFMIGLAKQTRNTLRETYKLCEDICRMNLHSELYGRNFNVWVSFGPMILLDPGSLAFDYPEKYGYRLIFKKFKDYYLAMSKPAWHQWISYETRFLTRRDIFDLILQSGIFMVRIKEKYHPYFHRGLEPDPLELAELNLTLFNILSNEFIAEEVDYISKIEDPQEKERRLKALNDALLELNTLYPSTRGMADPYGYRRALESILQRSAGLMTGD